jgi:hypothetical protein
MMFSIQVFVTAFLTWKLKNLLNYHCHNIYISEFGIIRESIVILPDFSYNIKIISIICTRNLHFGGACMLAFLGPFSSACVNVRFNHTRTTVSRN